MTVTALELAQHLLQAMQAKDKPASLALLAEDAVLVDPHYPNPVMYGKDAISGGLDFAFGMLKQLNWSILRTWEGPGTAVLEVETHHEMINGLLITPRQVFVVDARDGKIVRWQSFVPYPPPV